MTKKSKQRPAPVEDPSTASSSDSEEDDDRPHSSQQHAAAPQVSSSEEEDDSSEEEDEKKLSTLPASVNHPSKPHPKSYSSESEPDTDSEPARVKPKPKPTDLTQPKVQAQRSSTPVKPGSKRPAHVTEQKRAKKKPAEAPSPSVANDETEEDGKKSGGQARVLFQRIWSEEDELGILKGILEFISKTGQEPYRYVDAFHNFIKKSLHVEVSSHQLKEKIRRMKKKFETREAKKKKGIWPRLLRPHDRAVYELSKKIWGEWPNGLVEKPKPLAKYVTKTQKKESKAEDKVPSQPSAPLLALPAPESGDVSLLYSSISCFKELDEDEMKRGLTLIGESKRKELERRWKVLQYSEMELLANRSLLIGEQIKLVSEALQSSNN